METDVTPTEEQKIWQEYLQKCCEVGQLDHAVEQIESQRRQIEKNLETAKASVKSLANKHREEKQKQLDKEKQKVIQ